MVRRKMAPAHAARVHRRAVTAEGMHTAAVKSRGVKTAVETAATAVETTAATAGQGRVAKCDDDRTNQRNKCDWPHI
jgi:hypothetical protein